MGCSESKSSVATGNTITQSKKPSVAGDAPVDEPKKVENVENAVVPLENKASEGAADVKEVTRHAEVASEVEKKDDAAKEDEKEKPEKADETVKEEKAVEEKEPGKENGDKEVANKEIANNEEGSIKEAEPAPATPSPKVAETADTIVSEESNPPEKKE